MKTTILTAISITLLLLSCRKDTFITSPDASVTISTDTLHYDTVFTTVGSVTQTFKIINENNQKLRLSSVKLMGGSTSNFKMNVDGQATVEASNVEIAANDSIHVFVQVNVNPNADNLPFVIRDSIQVIYNGKTKWVQLEAWGQNAHFFRNKEVLADETWNNDLPYVIQGYLFVDMGQTLTIEKGCRIYVHADAPIVIDGTLRVNGAKDSIERVYFQGDRLDEPYKDYPAAWPGIYFRNSSSNNQLNYAVVRNAYQSIATEGPSSTADPKVTLNQCVIDNSYDAGIIALNSSITANNSLISNCGKNIAIGKGGDYTFNHCTVVSYSNSLIQHKDPVVNISNTDGAATVPLNAVFSNCIIWGDDGSEENKLVENEVAVTKSSSDNVVFDHTLWRVKTPPANITANNMINGQAPLFDSINVSKRFYNFRLREGSPAINSGVASSLDTDLDGLPRPVNAPDMGCFEKQ